MAEGRHDRRRALTARDELRVQQGLGGVIDDGEQGLVRRGLQRQPRVAAAIEMHQLAEARPRLAPAPMPAAGVLWYRRTTSVNIRPSTADRSLLHPADRF